MNKTSVMTLLPSSKEQLSTFVQGAKSEILSGEIEPLQVAIQLKAMEDIIKQLRSDSDIKELIISESEKYGQKTFETNGAKFTLRQSVSYDYEDKQIDEWKEQIKKRQDMLKNLTGEMADPETGEILKPATKKSADSISITLL